MNIRTILICLGLLGLASGSWASSISYTVLDAAASTSNLLQATVGRSDRTALDPGPHPEMATPAFTTNLRTGVPVSPAASINKYRLTSGVHNLAGSSQVYRPVPKPAERVAMPEPDMSLLLIFDLAFLAAAVTFLRSRYRGKKTI